MAVKRIKRADVVLLLRKHGAEALPLLAAYAQHTKRFSGQTAQILKGFDLKELIDPQWLRSRACLEYGIETLRRKLGVKP